MPPKGAYSVRLAAFPDATRPASAEQIEESLVVLKSPSLPVRGGQIAVISGLLRIDSPIVGHPDGLMIYDNIKGTVGALRYTRRSQGQGWEAFEIVREVPTSRELQVLFELHGQGVVRLDQVRVSTFSPGLETAGGATPASAENPRRGLLDFTPSLPKVRLWPTRPQDEKPAAARD